MTTLSAAADIDALASGVFRRPPNRAFVRALLDLSESRETVELQRDGVAHRVYEQYATAVGRRGTAAMPPASRVMQRDLEARLASRALSQRRDVRILECLDVAREYLDELLERAPPPRRRPPPRRPRSPTETVVTESTDLESWAG